MVHRVIQMLIKAFRVTLKKIHDPPLKNGNPHIEIKFSLLIVAFPHSLNIHVYRFFELSRITFADIFVEKNIT